MDSTFDETLRSAANSEDRHVPTTLLSVPGGLDVALNRAAWDMDAIFMSVENLGRMPEGAPGTLVLCAFFGSQQWRDRYSDCGRRLHELLRGRSPERQRKLPIAWARLALRAVDEQMADKYTLQRVTLPLLAIQQSIGDLVNRADRSTFDAETKKVLQGLLSRLTKAQRDQALGGRAGSQDALADGQPRAPSAAARPAWVEAAVGPTDRDLNPHLCGDPRPNLTKGCYGSATDYVETHFGLLREDFVRPLRQSIEAYRHGAELPQQVRVWADAELTGTTVGAPGGVLFCVRLASDEAAAQELDLPGGKSLMNGSLLVLSNDGFRSIRCGVVTRREAARQLGDGSIYLSLSTQTDEEMRSSKAAPQAAEEAAAVAPLIGQRFVVLQPGEYWGAYKPVLTALQSTASLESLPLADCLLRAENTDRAPPYLRRAIPPPSRGASRRGSQTNLAALAEGGGDAAAEREGGYDIRPILNATDQDAPYRISDVRREWPAQGSSSSSLDTWQLKAAKALLTRRLGLVQGPPGTGKTFVGLLVVRTLLRNAALWAASDATADKSGPSSLRSSLPVSQQASRHGSRPGSKLGSRPASRRGSRQASPDDSGDDSSSSEMPEEAKLALASIGGASCARRAAPSGARAPGAAPRRGCSPPPRRNRSGRRRRRRATRPPAVRPRRRRVGRRRRGGASAPAPVERGGGDGAVANSSNAESEEDDRRLASGSGRCRSTTARVMG